MMARSTHKLCINATIRGSHMGKEGGILNICLGLTILSTQGYKLIMDFGFLLKTLREKSGLSIKRLAPELDVNYTYLSKLENNKVSPSEELVERVSHYFAYSKEELLLAANKIPEDVLKILRENPTEAVAFLRKEFSTLGKSVNERRRVAAASRKPNKY